MADRTVTSFARLKAAGRVLWHAVLYYQTHGVSRQAAAIAFYGILSLAPLGVILVSIAGYVYGRDAAEGLLLGNLEGTLGHEAASAVQSMIDSVYRSPASVPATAAAVLVLVFGATRLIGSVRNSLNTIWEVPGRGGEGVKGYLVGKGLDIAMVLGLAGLLLVSLAANTAASAVARYFSDNLAFSPNLLQIGGVAFSLVVAAAVFIVVFRFLPNISISWKDVAFGGFLAAVLFTIGNYVLSLYLARSSFRSVFGAAGSFVVIMLWMYYSSIIVLFGVEVTRAYREHRRGVVRVIKRMPKRGDQATVEGRSGATHTETPAGRAPAQTTRAAARMATRMGRRRRVRVTRGGPDSPAGTSG